MTENTKRLALIVLLVVSPFVALKVGWDVFSHRLRVRLICHADHDGILLACRDLHKELALGRLEPGRYYLRSPSGSNELDLPECILQLKPALLYLYDKEDGRAVDISMLGRFKYAIGLRAYPDGVDGPDSHLNEIGKRQLVPGLWFYESGLEEDPGGFSQIFDKVMARKNKLNKDRRNSKGI